MIRILHIVNSMDRGGIETTLMNIFRNIDREKVMFDFLLQTDKKCDYNEEIIELGGKIFSVTPRRKSITKNKKELKDFFKEHKEYKIIHMHVSSLTYITPLKIAKKYKVPIRIIHSRNTRAGGSKIHKYIHLINKFFIQNIATDYFSCSDLAGNWLYNKKILNGNKYRIINNGIDSEKFEFSLLTRNIIRKELKCDNDVAIINVGRLHPQKNHMFMLETIKELCKINNNVKLFLIGEGALRGQIELKIKELQLSNNVILLGKCSNVNEVLQGMDIFLMPSFYEGLPGSVIEAQGAGLPCVISDTITKKVAITDLVKFLSINKPAKEWAQEINVLSKNNIRRKTSEEIKKQGFDMKDISQKLEEFYIKRYMEVNVEK